MNLSGCKAVFDEVAADYERTVSDFGLAFEDEESQPRSNRFEGGAWICENCGKSLRGGNGWISQGCLACRTGEKTVTFFISLKCPKNCYFCFNPNQEDYELYRRTCRDAVGELEQVHTAGVALDCIALTGGEPLLHFDETLAFFKRAHELYPGVHTRLYTSGFGLDEADMDALQESGLQEIRFSIKLEDSKTERRAVEELMRVAVDHLPDVMVEMPVIPGTLDEMKELLDKLAAWGLKGINLLEFCFPLNNGEAFKERGFSLRKQPFDVLYNYWYGGGIPVAGSEAEALELLRYADERGLDIGVHYCSSDNKNTGQLYQQNSVLPRVQTTTRRYLAYRFDRCDHFIKCAKAFGKDVARVEQALEALSRSQSGVSWEFDGGELVFPDTLVADVRACVPEAEIGISFNVLEPVSDGVHMREVDIVSA